MGPCGSGAGLILLTEDARGGARQHRLALIDDGFQQFDRRLLVRGAADVSRADIVIVGEDAGDLAIQVDTLDPVLLHLSRTFKDRSWSGVSRAFCSLVNCGGRWRRSRFLAEIGVDAAAISAGVQGRDHALAVRANP